MHELSKCHDEYDLWYRSSFLDEINIPICMTQTVCLFYTYCIHLEDRLFRSYLGFKILTNNLALKNMASCYLGVQQHRQKTFNNLQYLGLLLNIDTSSLPMALNLLCWEFPLDIDVFHQSVVLPKFIVTWTRRIYAFLLVNKLTHPKCSPVP